MLLRPSYPEFGEKQTHIDLHSSEGKCFYHDVKVFSYNAMMLNASYHVNYEQQDSFKSEPDELRVMKESDCHPLNIGQICQVKASGSSTQA